MKSSKKLNWKSFLYFFLVENFLNFELSKRLHNNDEVARMREVMTSIEETGTYTLTEQELSFGAKLAWRNASRCIGRKQWLNLKVRKVIFRSFQSVQNQTL